MLSRDFGHGSVCGVAYLGLIQLIWVTLSFEQIAQFHREENILLHSLHERHIRVLEVKVIFLLIVLLHSRGLDDLLSGPILDIELLGPGGFWDDALDLPDFLRCSQLVM